jgi:glycosyltransferase involved in cell wall biosynthesis
MNRRLKILVSAYACEPGRGSEPGVGWNWARQLARQHEVWVITRPNNRGPIEAALAREPNPNLHFVYSDLPRWARFWKRGALAVRPYYYLWQAAAYFTARRLARRVQFDLAHHVTFVKYWAPSFVALLDTPFIWGPVGGGESAPRAFQAAFSLHGKLYNMARNAARALAGLDPFLALTARRARLGLATTEETAQRMRSLGCRNVHVFASIGLSDDDLAELAQAPVRAKGPFRIVSLGNLLQLKGFDLALQAFAQFVRDGYSGEYWLIGDGPERRRLEALAASLGVSGRVRFWGQLKRPQALERLAECDVLAHPSLHDSGGCVCLEAMAAARPVVCLDLGGPALKVTSETGIKIPARNPKQAIADLTLAFETLASNPALRARMGEAGRARVRRDFHWDHKPAQLLGLLGGMATLEGARR